MENILILIILAGLVGAFLWLYFKEYLVHKRAVLSDMVTLQANMNSNNSTVLEKVKGVQSSSLNAVKGVTALMGVISLNNNGAYSDITKSKNFKSYKILNGVIKELVRLLTDSYISILDTSVTSSAITVNISNGVFRIPFNTGVIKASGSGAISINLTTIPKSPINRNVL